MMDVLQQTRITRDTMAKIVISTCDGKFEISPMCLYRDGKIINAVEDPTIVESDISDETE